MKATSAPSFPLSAALWETVSSKSSSSSSSSSLTFALPSPVPLTKTASSWVIHVPRFFPSPSRSTFQQIFDTHPPNYHPLVLFGRQVMENRYSQLYMPMVPMNTNTSDSESAVENSRSTNVDEKTTLTAARIRNPYPRSSKVGINSMTTDNLNKSSDAITYSYSGSSRPCISCDPTKEEEQFITDLCRVADQLITKLMDDGIVEAGDNHHHHHNGSSNSNGIYNCCLVNWYRPDHSIGLHSDDEQELDLSVPILSLSWGGPRRFLLRPKPHIVPMAHHPKMYEIQLQDGDLLIMGGKCQQEFKHEVPKVRKMDGLVNDRICWTIRSMKRREQRVVRVAGEKRKRHMD